MMSHSPQRFRSSCKKPKLNTVESRDIYMMQIGGIQATCKNNQPLKSRGECSAIGFFVIVILTCCWDFIIGPRCPWSDLCVRRLSAKIGFVLRLYSVFENGQWKVKVFQIQYSNLINFIWNKKNQKDSNILPPPPHHHLRHTSGMSHISLPKTNFNTKPHDLFRN